MNIIIDKDDLATAIMNIIEFNDSFIYTDLRSEYKIADDLQLELELCIERLEFKIYDLFGELGEEMTSLYDLTTYKEKKEKKVDADLFKIHLGSLLVEYVKKYIDIEYLFIFEKIDYNISDMKDNNIFDIDAVNNLEKDLERLCIKYIYNLLIDYFYGEPGED